MESFVVACWRTAVLDEWSWGMEGWVGVGGKISRGHMSGAEWDLNIEELGEVEKAAEGINKGNMWDVT